MAYWNMLKKLRGHSALEPGEVPLAAVYGLGEAMLRMADGAAQGLRGGPAASSPLDGPDVYSTEFLAATEGRNHEGTAARIAGNGVLGLTNRRVLWFKKATVVGRLGDPALGVPVASIVNAEHSGNIVRLVFDDRSITALHVPRTQDPHQFVSEFANLNETGRQQT